MRQPWKGARTQPRAPALGRKTESQLALKGRKEETVGFWNNGPAALSGLGECSLSVVPGLALQVRAALGCDMPPRWGCVAAEDPPPPVFQLIERVLQEPRDLAGLVGLDRDAHLVAR